MANQPLDRVTVVFAGGDAPPSGVTRWLPPHARLIAADSGLDHAHRLGFEVDLLVGDLDSVSHLARQRHNGEVEPHPEAKDCTDLELAMLAAVPDADLVILVGGHGGRLDHLLANAQVLADPRWSQTRVVWLAGEDLVTVVHHRTMVRGAPGDLVSLVPIGGHAMGVATEGMQWVLGDSVLAAGTSRGVSNRLIEDTAEVSVQQGVLLVVQPGAVLSGKPDLSL